MNALVNSTRPREGARPIDPIFEALERREQIYVALEDTKSDTPELGQQLAAGDDRVTDSKVTTLAGAVALLRMIRAECECDLDGFFVNLLDKVIATLEACSCPAGDVDRLMLQLSEALAGFQYGSYRAIVEPPDGTVLLQSRAHTVDAPFVLRKLPTQGGVSAEMQKRLMAHQAASERFRCEVNRIGEGENDDAWEAANEAEHAALLDLLAHTPRSLEEVGTIGRYLHGRQAPYDFEDLNMPGASDTFIEALSRSGGAQ